MLFFPKKENKKSLNVLYYLTYIKTNLLCDIQLVN